MTESSGHIASGARCRKKRKIWLLNLLFLLAGAGILFLLWLAPPASTPAMPKDEHHAPYQTGSKRAAEKHCQECHGPEMSNPLPKQHPPPYRCLFCHRRA